MMKDKTQRQGFTLVELLVAMTVFIIAMTIAAGSFIRAVRTQRAVGNQISVNSNMSLVIERMAREIRTGYNFGLNDIPSGSCVGGQLEELEFTNPRLNLVSYRAESGAVARRECSGADCSGASFEPLSASNVEVERLCFSNTGNIGNGRDPWRISLFFQIGSVESAITGGPMNIQTTVAARIIPEEVQ